MSSSSILSLIATVASFFHPAKYESISSKVKLNSEHLKGMAAVAFIAVYEHEKKNPSSSKEDRKGAFLDSVGGTYDAFKPLKKNGSFAPASAWEIVYDEKPEFARGSMGKIMQGSGVINDTDQAFVQDYTAAGYSVDKNKLTFIAQQNQRIAKFIFALEPEAEESETEASSDDDACADECPESSDSEVDECHVKNFKL